MLTYAVQQDSCIEDMQWEIDLIDRYEWERALPPHEFMGMHSTRKVVHEPIGVVGAITPWNFPFMLNLSKITPALPRRQHRRPQACARHAVERDVHRPRGRRADRHPAGRAERRDVGRAATVGEMLTTDPRVDLVSFTGSTATGRRIMASGARR